MKKLRGKNYGGSVEYIAISRETIEFDCAYEESDLIHLEMNLIELPIFNKNNKIKDNTSIIYNFNKDKSSFLHVKPGANLGVPGEKEEKIFYALLKIFQRNDFLDKKYCYTDYFEIIKEMNLEYSGRERQKVKKGLEVLREVQYEFQNSFYTRINGEHQRVSFNELKKIINIAFITYDKAASEEEKKLFTNNKKEIIRIELSDFIKENIANKIFLYFSREELMSIENAVTRNLWIKFTKWRNGKLFLKVSSKNVATKIPLAWTPSTYSKTIMIIKKSLDDLKEKKLIENYEFVNNINGKKLTNDKTYFEVHFEKFHNEKRNNFTMGKNSNYGFIEYESNIEHIEYKVNEKDNIQEAEIVESKNFEDLVKREVEGSIEELCSLLSEKGKKLSTMKGKIEKALNKNTFEEVKTAILYTNKNSKTSYGKYFTDTLENRWYDDSKDLLLSDYEIKKLDSSEIKKRLEDYGIDQAISYTKRNQYVSKDWDSSVDERLLKLAVETSGEYSAMITKLLYSKISKAPTRSLASIIENLISENSFDDFMKKRREKEAVNTQVKLVEEIPVEEIKRDTSDFKKFFNMGREPIEVNLQRTHLTQREKEKALSYLKEKEDEKINLTIYLKRCEMGLENSSENEKLLSEILKKYETAERVLEPIEIVIEKETQLKAQDIEDELFKNEKKVRGIKEIFDEELNQYEGIFREFSPEEKLKLKSMTLKRYLEECKGNTNEDTLRRIMSENVIILFDL